MEVLKDSPWAWSEAWSPNYEPVPLIKGGSLALLDEQNRARGLGLLYHGTARPLDKLYPRPVFWSRDDGRLPDSDIDVICADRNPLVAAFMAIKPPGDLIKGYRPNMLGGITFHLHPNLQELFEAGTGCVAVLDHEGFAPHDSASPQGWRGLIQRPPGEMRSILPQQPLCNIVVNYDDFSGLLEADSCSKLEYRDYMPT